MAIFSFNQTSREASGSNKLEFDGAYTTLDSLMGMRWKAKSLALPSAKRVSKDQIGSHQSRFRGRGMEFSEVRAYQPGDDVRSIDWRVTARRQKPHTKIFHEERERPILIVCDQSQSMFFGSQVRFKSVAAAEVFALLAWSALGHGDRVGGIVFNDNEHEECKPTLNRKHLLNFISTVDKYNHRLSLKTTVNQSLGFKNVLRETVRLAKPGTLVIFISDFYGLDNGCEKDFATLSNHCDLIFTHVKDSLETSLPVSGYLPISDGESVVAIDNKTSYAQKHYQQWFLKRYDYLSDTARSLRAPLISLSTHDDPVAELRRLISGLF